jgi:hypothetical protein
MHNGLNESYYRDLLAKQVGGRVEAKLIFGRADVLTDTHIFEVEPIATWRHGASQALQYGSQVGQRGALAIYGEPDKLAHVFRELARLPEPGLELWWLAGDEFVLLRSAADLGRYTLRGPEDATEDGPGAWPRWVTPDYWAVERADY